MALEDFTTYTEVEPDDRIQKTANHVDLLGYRDEDAYLYKDMGAAHFGNFDHKLDAKLVNGNWVNYIWGLANGVDDLYALSPSLGVLMHGADNKTYMHEDAAQVDVSTGTFTDDVMYYFRIKRSGTTLTCDVYGSAADRDNEANRIDNLSLSATVAATTYRYVYACSTLHYDTNHTFFSTHDIENLDLQEAAGLSIPVAMHHYNRINKIIRG